MTDSRRLWGIMQHASPLAVDLALRVPMQARYSCTVHHATHHTTHHTIYHTIHHAIHHTIQAHYEGYLAAVASLRRSWGHAAGSGGGDLRAWETLRREVACVAWLVWNMVRRGPMPHHHAMRHAMHHAPLSRSAPRNAPRSAPRSTPCNAPLGATTTGAIRPRLPHHRPHAPPRDATRRGARRRAPRRAALRAAARGRAARQPVTMCIRPVTICIPVRAPARGRVAARRGLR